ncbi:hypothetical protein JCM24511_03822 [Saitozyma sp. JCM 24511]|nr:hypothetical protein JCM24511_03822 [Saitozyma sp. JCM 24511]
MPNGGGRSALSTDKSAFKQATPFLIFCVFTMSIGELLFGLDASAFAQFQVLPSWLKVFGERNAKGAYALSTDRKSLMTSVQWVGKLAGTIVVEPMVHRIGYKKTMYVMCAIQFLGCILEMATSSWIVFSCGRVFQYLCIGIIENAGPTYASETSPAALRAACVSFLFIVQGLGGVITSGIFQGISTSTNPNIWLVPAGVQLIPGVIVLLSTPFIVESPRLLVAWGRKDAAAAALNKLRVRTSTSEQANAIEVEAIEQAILEAKRLSSQGGWIELFRGTNLRRTMIAIWIFIFQQWTGQQFVTSYGPTFYTSVGRGSQAFIYTLIGGILHLVLGLPFAWAYDKVGRRPLLIGGTVIATVFLVIIGILGPKTNPSTAELNTVVASLMLFRFFESFSLSQACWIIGPEIGSSILRKKTMAIATFVDVIAAFGVTYSSPYMLAALGSRVAFVFTGISVFALIFSIFFVPETKGRSLEELDEMFEAKLWAWQFSRYETKGVGHAIAELEADKAGKENLVLDVLGVHDDKNVPEHVEDSKV